MICLSQEHKKLCKMKDSDIVPVHICFQKDINQQVYFSFPVYRTVTDETRHGRTDARTDGEVGFP